MVYSQCIGIGPGPVQEPNGKYIEMFTVDRDRDRNQDQLLPIVSVPFPPRIQVPYNVFIVRYALGGWLSGSKQWVAVAKLPNKGP